MVQEEASFLRGLNERQNEAVREKSGAILVLAGAGSGKTKVLTSRIANLVDNGADPNEILAVTFTNKASKEMRQRLSLYLGEPVVKKMWVGTFHSISGRILRRHLELYKTKDGRSWNNNFVIYDDTDTKTVIKNAIKKMNLDEKIYEAKMIKSIISNAKNKMQDAYAFATSARDYKSEKISEIYYEYEKQLALNNALDFDDMLMLTVNLMKQNEEVRQIYSERFKHILVDEFQDTNKTQYEFINLLFNQEKALKEDCSLCAVGDVDQSIYSWRGADYKIILNFQKDYRGTKLIKLEQNYRSTGTILNAANEVIKNNTERLDKNLYSTKGDGDKILLFEAESDYEESLYVAKKIKELYKNGISYEDMAVLYRTNAQSRSIEEALMSNNTPYKIVGGLRFYERKEIKDIIAYLKLIYNKNDNQSLRRVINVPKRGIGDATVKKIIEIADEKEVSAFTVIENINDYPDFTSRHTGVLLNFANLINSLINKQKEYELSEFAALVMEDTGYVRELKEEDTVENQSRLDNLQEFINVIKEFEADEFEVDEEEDLGALGNFLSQVALVSDIDEVKEEEKSVTLMTLHAAKGLEFPVIFLVGLEEGLFPGSKAVQFESKTELEEERRLMYVGITRAKEILHLTHAKRRRVWGDVKFFPKSRFIEEIPENLLEEDVLRGSGVEYNNGWGGNNLSGKSGDFSGKKDWSSFKKPNSSFKNAVSAKKEAYQNSGGSIAKSANSIVTKSSGGSSSSNPNNLASSLKDAKKKATIVVKKKAATVNSAPLKESKPVEKAPDFSLLKAKFSAPAPALVPPKKESKEETKQTVDVSALISKCKQKAVNSGETLNIQGFPKGARVFHSTFGIGFIKDSKTLNGETTYTVEFTKHGIKELDSKNSNLKSF